MPDNLADFTKTSFSYDNKTRDVYRQGRGPAVVIMHEIPGITPQVAEFGRHVARAGFTAVLPVMFGTPGKDLSIPYVLQQMALACINKEFNTLAKRQSSPITDWLRALCRAMHKECGGRGVGAIGMCLTGNFALSLMADESVMAPVLSQPSLPFPITAAHRAATGISDDEMAIARKRAQSGCRVLGLRFTEDPLCTAARFETLRNELGAGFEAIEIDSSPGNKYHIKRTAHSVVTTDLIDKDGHPTREALDRVLALFREQLLGKKAR